VQLVANFLADFAEIINGKLYVQGGLVTQVGKPIFPAPLDLSLVLVFKTSPHEAGTNHQLEVRLHDADGSPLMDPLQANMGIGQPPPEAQGLPLFGPLAVRLNVPIPRAGTYEFVFLLDGHDIGSMPFRAQELSLSIT
jgi:Family of unknown function (DUF6941)